METIYDVAIVGASLAGTSAAITLAKAGLRVALIDKATFPRRKPCGEGLSNFGLKQLEALGAKNEILSLPHLIYQGYRIKSERSSVLIKSPWDENITIQRKLLDAKLLSIALKSGAVTPYLGQAALAITEHEIHLATHTVHARNIILASGSNSALLKQISHRVKRTGPSRSGISVLFKGGYQATPQEIVILLRKEFEIYCTPLADGYLNISLLTKSTNSRKIKELLVSKELQQQVFGECSFYGEQASPLEGRTNIGNIRRDSNVATIFFAGDVKEEFDPIGGMGMSHALRSGIQAAEQILEVIKDLPARAPRYSNFARFNKNPSLGAMRFFTALTYRTLRTGRQFPILLRMASSPPGAILIKHLTKELA